MSASHDEGWDTLDTLWRSQAVTAPDFDRLQREARARGWRLRAVTAFEWIVLAATGVFFWRVLPVHAQWQAIDHVAMALYVVAAAFTAWTTYNRRGLSRSGELAPRTLVQREIHRAEASLRFWRVNTWVIVLMFAALSTAAIAQSLGLLPTPRRASWAVVALINLPLVVASLALHRQRARRLDARLDTLRELLRQVED
jgi:hypothetical protein